MDAFLKSIGAMMLVACIVFVAPIIGVLIGAFSGWVVSMLAPVWVPSGLKYIGINIQASNLVELGAALGFIGGFFRVDKSDKKD